MFNFHIFCRELYTLLLFSHVVDQVENPHDTVSSRHGKHVTLVGEVDREYCAAEFLDLGNGLERVNRVKDFDLVASRTTSNDILSGGLHELSTVDLAGAG